MSKGAIVNKTNKNKQNNGPKSNKNKQTIKKNTKNNGPKSNKNKQTIKKKSPLKSKKNKKTNSPTKSNKNKKKKAQNEKVEKYKSLANTKRHSSKIEWAEGYAERFVKIAEDLANLIDEIKTNKEHQQSIIDFYEDVSIKHDINPNTKQCRCICNQKEVLTGVCRLKQHMSGNNCELNLSKHHKSIDIIVVALKEILDEIFDKNHMFGSMEDDMGE